MLQAKRSLLREFPLFCDVNDNTAGALVCGAQTRQVAKDATLIVEGETPDHLHVLVEGLVALSASHDGRQTTIEVARPGAALMLAAVIGGGACLCTARTLEASQILTIPAAEIRALFARDAGFARAIVKDLTDGHERTLRALKNFKLRTGAERLAAWIMRNAGGQDGRVELPFDKRTLASYLGMTPENLSRNLALLAKHGVRSLGRDIVVEDAAALALVAKPNALIDD
jgi:CRP/FNR family transcriptional activator FtrB